MDIRKIKTMCAVALLMFGSSVVAAPHTWHVINVKGAEYNGSLQSINENATFVKSDGTAFNTFVVTPEQPVRYGFSFGPNDDFDVAYTLTLTEKKSPKNSLLFRSKTCVFVITAKGPAQPDIQSLTYNGATCSYNVVKGVGEDFFVS